MGWVSERETQMREKRQKKRTINSTHMMTQNNQLMNATHSHYECSLVIYFLPWEAIKREN